MYMICVCSPFYFTKTYVVRKTLELFHASQRSDLDSKPFPFARLPLELRRKVYEFALGGECRRILVSSLDRSLFKEDAPGTWKYTGVNCYPGCDPLLWHPAPLIRSTRQGRGMGINTAILRASHTVHAEAEALLYQLHEFEFKHQFFGVISFLAIHFAQCPPKHLWY